MRLFIACNACRRQFSVTEDQIGTYFHCHCGQAVQVREPHGHDASVVSCSSCGAPRINNAVACGHCDSDFTLHEQDLDTVCPQCLARISGRARFCHHCGVPIAPEPLPKQMANAACPACENSPPLAHRRLGDPVISVLECQSCAGLWIPLGPFEALLDREALRKDASLGPKPAAWRPQTGRTYRPCVVCQGLMVRRNVGADTSRVIIDVCGLHGLWFDNEELAHVLAWVRAGGGREVQADLANLKGSQNRHLRRKAPRPTPAPQRSSAGSAAFGPSDSLGGNVLPLSMELIMGSLFTWLDS